MTGLLVFHLIVCAALLCIAVQTWGNLRVMPRLEPGMHPATTPLVSVLIPARNEADKIERCVRSWMSQTYPRYEVLVYDDDSSDATGMRAATAGAGRVRVLGGGTLPAGWRGKPYACHRLRREAKGEILLFVDADITPAPATLSSAVTALANADVLSAIPLHTSPRVVVQAVAAIQNWAAASFIPLWASARSRTVAALNG